MNSPKGRARQPANKGGVEGGHADFAAHPAAEHRGKSGSTDDVAVKEFGGPIGVTAMMIGFPILMYYLWISAEFYKGGWFLPTGYSLPELQAFAAKFCHYIYEHAFPTLYACAIYLGFCLLQFALATFVPGPYFEGMPIPHEGNRKLKYLCNATSCWWITLALAFFLHVSGIWRLTAIVDHFGEIMTVAILFGFFVTIWVYAFTLMHGTPYRMSGNHLYDMFMGASLNPRLGPVDLKLWIEIRVPWPILFFVSVSALLKRYEVSGEVYATHVFICLAQFLYTNACQKGEEYIPTTWDIFYEKWGFMLIFWNAAGVPFTYCLSSLYMLHAGPIVHETWAIATLFVVLLIAYYIWDTAMSQKCSFRAKLNGIYRPRFTFPQLPWRTLENPKFLVTKAGSPLLVDGWWKYARKVNYTADLVMSLSWGLVAGLGSYIPYFYFTFFVCVLTHRAIRDNERCARKYGDDWVRYTKEVPYTFIPGVF